MVGGHAVPLYTATRELNGAGLPAVALSVVMFRLPLEVAVHEYHTSLLIGPALGQPVPGKLCGVPVIALVLVKGRGPVTPPHEIGALHVSLAGGVLVTENTPVAEAVCPVPSALVMVRLRGPTAAPEEITNDSPLTVEPPPLTDGVPTTLMPELPVTLTWLALVTPPRLTPVMVTGTR
jgi:hypothetical protein